MAVAAAVAGTPFAATTNVASYATDSWTPTDGRLYLVAVGNSDATAAVIPTLSGNSQTWTQVATQLSINLQFYVTVFRCLAAGSSSGALTADFAADAQTGCFIHISEWTGMDTSGTNGSGAIVQAVGGQWAATANPSITLAAFGSADNATYGAFCTFATDPSVGSGFTVLTESTYLTPTRFFITEWKATNDTGVDVTAAADSGNGIAIEVKAAVAAAAQVPYRNQMPTLIAQ